MTDAFGGPLLGARYLIHDRDTKCTASFDRVMSSVGIKSIKLPARSPNLNVYGGRWVLSVKSEAYDRLILLNERQVRQVLGQYPPHYHAERCHQGIDGQLIEPRRQDETAGTEKVVRYKRLGGLLSYCHRPAA